MEVNGKLLHSRVNGDAGGRLPRRTKRFRRCSYLARLSFPECFYGGSFVTSKEVPNDVDVLLVMAADFAIEALLAHQQVLFDHVQARLRFHADVFWTKASMHAAVLDLWLDTYQTGKDFRRRGIVEVVVP